MGLEDMVSTQSAFVAATTAAVVSPKTRGAIRKGAVYGIAGALKVGDVVAGAARGVVNGVRGEDTAVSDAAADVSSTASEPGQSRASARRAAATTRSAGSAAGS